MQQYSLRWLVTAFALGIGVGIGLGACAPATTPAAPAASSSPPASTTVAPTVAAPEPLMFEGDGKSVLGPFPLKQGLLRVTMKYDGTPSGSMSNFAVKLMDDQGKLVSLLANELGKWDGEKAQRIDKNGSYLLDITASGPWSVRLVQ